MCSSFFVFFSLARKVGVFYPTLKEPLPMGIGIWIRGLMGVIARRELKSVGNAQKVVDFLSTVEVAPALKIVRVWGSHLVHAASDR